MDIQYYRYLKEEFKWCFLCNECIDDPNLFKLIIRREKKYFCHINCYHNFVNKYLNLEK